MKVLEMVNDGKLEELKTLLADEIYKNSLKGNGDANRRYAAMKRYFKYANMNNKACSMPCKDVELSDGSYNCFVDGFSIVCTTENIGELESYDNSDSSYLKIEQMLNYPSEYELIDLNKVLAEAKSKGYKYKKSEIGQDASFQYAFKYRDGYFKIGLLDQAYSIINDGNEAEVYYNGAKGLLLIKTSLGVCGVLPFNYKDEMNSKTIIQVESKFSSKVA